IDLDYEQNPDGRYHLAKSTMKASFAAKKSADKGIFGERTISYTNYRINVPRADSVYAGGEATVRPDAMKRTEAFWVNSRGHDTLTNIEVNAYKNIDSLQTIPSFKRLMGTINLLAVGFAEAGPVEIGPIGTFYSYNPVEGSRAKFALRTTDTFSTRYYLAGYGAYGFTDKRFKYLLSAAYSFNNKSIYKFPNDYIKLSTQYEVKIPGEELAFVQADQFYTSFTRGVNNKFLYNRYYKIDYVHELESHFSYSFEFKNWQQTPAGSLYFNNTLNGTSNRVGGITTSELAVGLRYAPHEQIFQGKLYRVDIPNKYPILTLNYQQDIKGLFGGQYNYQNIYGRIDKRFYLSQLGYADLTVEGSYLFGQVPFPLLDIQHANQTYVFQLHSYNLMNFLEFVSDRYADVKLDYDLNGFIFNKIPLLKKLKLREIVSFKVLYGGLRSENDPTLHPSLLQFPTDQNGTPITYTLGKQPYMEGGIGIGNIFKIFRIDLVERFNYLNNPNVSRFGIRGSAWFDF
ncbi:MAG: carboxypeptidase-like regulatory domain-containing protein, partial [Bacteroidetes bacterium]|nr:carboxypeptidase-like regulatory domain-containing protein [Bacteroidota bacterium]